MEGTPVSRREGQVVREIRGREMVIFTPRDIVRFLTTSRLNAYRIVSSMEDKGLARRLERGKYVLTETWNELDVYEIVPEVLKPSYIGFWSALHYHRMTDQVPRTVFMATTRRKRPLRLRGQKIRYVTIKSQLFFGYERFGKVVVSDMEKTIIDCLGHLAYSGGIGQVYDALTRDLEVGKMVDYCVRTGSQSIASRLGYVMEKKRLDFDRDRLRAMLNTYTKLDPRGAFSGLEPPWRLYANRDLS